MIPQPVPFYAKFWRLWKQASWGKQLIRIYFSFSFWWVLIDSW